MIISEIFKNRLKSLAGIKNTIQEAKNHKNEYGCLMLEIKYEGQDDILKIIDKDDLYTAEEGFGLEKNPHVTILFGFHDNADIDKIKNLTKEHCSEPVEILLKNITMFENVENKYDVLKFDVKCPKLNELNKVMTDNFDYTSDFPDYHPHTTIAYVKTGTGKKYVSKKEDLSVLCDNFFYSTKDNKTTYFKI